MDENTDPPAGAPAPGARDWAAEQEQSMDRMIAKVSTAFAKTMSEPATRAERIAVAILQGDANYANHPDKLVAAARAIDSALGAPVAAAEPAAE